MHPLLEEIDARFAAMFTALAAGDDLAPGPRLRTEGLMEAAVLLGIADGSVLCDLMDQAYFSAFSRSLAEDFGEDWTVFFPFPQIPAMARRAPVVPSTKD